MLQDLYFWYLENMDSIPVQMAQVVVEEVIDAQERYTKPQSGGIVAPIDFDIAAYTKASAFGMVDGSSFVGRSKWDRIGKPFVEDMVKLNAAIHFWNPAGKFLGAVSRYMRLEDWDDPERMLEYVLD